MGRMLVKLAEAIGRLVLAGREMTRLAGFTARVTEIMNVLKDLNRGQYVRNMLQNDSSEKASNAGENCYDSALIGLEFAFSREFSTRT